MSEMGIFRQLKKPTGNILPRRFRDLLAVQLFTPIARLRLLYRSVALFLEIDHERLACDEETSVGFRKHLLRLLSKRPILQVQLTFVLSNREPEQAFEKVRACVGAKRCRINLGKRVLFHTTIVPGIFLRDSALDLANQAQSAIAVRHDGSSLADL